MNKIKLTVASLLLSGICYAQSPNKMTEVEKKRQTLEWQIDDMISAIRMDMYYGRVFEEAGNYYINELIKIRNLNKRVGNDLQVTLNTKN